MKLRLFRPLAALIFAFPLLAANAVAQSSATWTVTGPWGADSYARGGDFNGDGKTDIASPTGATAHMKLNTGSGFTSETWIVDGGATGWGQNQDVLIGDFNCDHRDEFVIVRQGNAANIDIKFGDQFAHTFTTVTWPIVNLPIGVPAIEPMWGSAGFVRVGDFDGDGCKDDIVTPGVQGTSSHGHVMVGKRQQFGLGTSEFEFAESTMNSSWGTTPWVLVEDYNNDGRDDVASANGGNVYMNLATAPFLSGGKLFLHFTSAVWPVSGSWGTTNYAAAGTPSSGAGYIMSPKTGTTNIYLKTPSGSSSFNASTWTTNSTWGQPQWTFSGDFDGDGQRDDFASANGGNVYMKFQ